MEKKSLQIQNSLSGIGILFDFNRIKGKGIVTNPTSTSHDVKKPESTAVLNDTEDKDMNNSSTSQENSGTLTFEPSDSRHHP